MGPVRSEKGKIMIATVALEVTTCPTCGVTYAAPEHMIAELRRNGGTIFCPSGHRGSWKETETDRIRKQLEAEQRQTAILTSQLDQEKALTADQRKRKEKIERQLIATKGVVTRLKNKAAKGECPCCSESFPDLAAHMTAAHPEYEQTPDVVEDDQT